MTLLGADPATYALAHGNSTHNDFIRLCRQSDSEPGLVGIYAWAPGSGFPILNPRAADESSLD